MKKILLLLVLLSSVFCKADCNQPNFCDRDCWDPNGTHPMQNNPTFTTVTHMIVHHTGDGIVFPTNTDFAEKVRFYWDLHVNTNGWSDIGYNWLIDRNGVIYEGRGDGVLGAHFSGMNGGTMGVALIGDFELENPSNSAINSLRNLLAWEATDKNINVTVSTYHASSGQVLNNISGHLDVGGTLCPGTDLYSLLPSIRTAISNLSCYNGGSSTGPDLVIEEMWTEPANPQAGEIVDLYVRIKNVGSVIAEDIHLEYFINGDYIDDDSHSSLEPGEERVEYENNYVFASNGSFNYCVYIDAVTNEQNIANNSYCIPVSVNGQSGGGNIYLTNISVNPLTVNSGQEIEVVATQNYSGSQLDSDLESFDLDYYLSADCNLSSNDILLGGDSSSLGSDDPSHDESATLTIPGDTPEGTYYIIFSADNENELTENNEDDNIECVQITVTNSSGPEDITVTDATVSPTTIIAGQGFTVSANQNYSGSQLDSNLSNFHLGYYLSADCTLNSGDILLGNDQSGLGSDDPTNSETESLTIPAATSPGVYYIIFSADDENIMNESNENNNTACVQITVTGTLSITDNDFQNQITLVPNPTADIINILAAEKLSINRASVYDIRGRLLIQVIENNLKKISLGALPAGLYIVELMNEENKKAVYKILKE